MLQLMREGCSYIYPPLSIARYSFLQLSELKQCRVKKLAQGVNTGFEPGSSWSRVRSSTREPLRSTTGLRKISLLLLSSLYKHYLTVRIYSHSAQAATSCVTLFLINYFIRPHLPSSHINHSLISSAIIYVVIDLLYYSIKFTRACVCPCICPQVRKCDPFEGSVVHL